MSTTKLENKHIVEPLTLQWCTDRTKLLQIMVKISQYIANLKTLLLDWHFIDKIFLCYINKVSGVVNVLFNY